VYYCLIKFFTNVYVIFLIRSVRIFMNYIMTNFENFFYEYGLSIVLLNIIIYTTLLFSMFSLIFVFDLRFFRTLNELKSFGNLQFFLITCIFTLLSMAGVPPLTGFVSKFLMFILIFLKKNILFTVLFGVINFFTIYFYIQNVRFLANKSSNLFFFFKKNYAYISFSLSYILVVLNFLNFFGVIFLGDFLIFLDNFCLYLSNF